MSIFVRARFDAHDQRQGEFEKIALALARQAANEPGTRTFRWFSAGTGSYVVLEEYDDEAAAVAHNERGAHLLARVPECATMAYAEIHGPVGPRIREWAGSQSQVSLYPDFHGDDEV
ncbi:putative quinol monooxygenase [Nonomuraea sp. NPDC050783]|uniref:putative quinol monooxygenase n=1 Tax=Nonomuraea sp. NPDC050783 TaxID=3154634 RepID=UPI003467B7A4